MSVADLHNLELIWPSLGPTDVIVTGTFDQWSSSIHLVKGDGGFFGTVKVPWGQRIAYKYIVDGRWRCRDDRPQEDDGHGNINNVLLTPEKPASPMAHDPPRLSIPTEGTSHDAETMVTALEFLPSASEPAGALRGTLPLPIPQITVDLSQTPVIEPRLDRAVATEEDVSPTLVTPAGFEPSSCDVTTLSDNDIGSAPLPPVDGNREPPTSALVAETTNEVMVLSSESATAQSDLSLKAAQDVPAVADRIDDPPTTVVEPPTIQPEANPPETMAQGPHQEDATPVSNNPAPTASTPPSSTSVHKKRWSLFERIKHIFDKDKEKRGKKKKH